MTKHSNPIPLGVKHMQLKMINTNLGKIAVYLKNGNTEKIPLIFLHGVYFDHQMWEDYVAQINDRTVISVDMPLHGNSKEIEKHDWNMDDCSQMLLDILNGLKIDKVIAIGHSWGSMSIVRAVHKNPHRFYAIGLCNLKFRAETKRSAILTYARHLLLPFKTFYLKQVALVMFDKKSIAAQPDLPQKLIKPMSKLSSRDIMTTDRAIIINPTDSSYLVANLTIPTHAIVGESDYVGVPPIAQTEIVPGGHVSPLEAKAQVLQMIRRLCV
jgi:pimeloyl-ACP methyl ester carboxylesterase